MSGVHGSDEPAQWLRRFLNVHWLRPETALIFAFDAAMYRKYRVTGDRAIDIGCGDGITSFLFNGGDLDPAFDAYYSLNTRASFVYSEESEVFQPGSASDFYDGFDPRDFEGATTIVARRPDMMFLYGTDWKQTLIDKAAYLDFYRHLVCHDSRQPFTFIGDGSLSFVFSNTIYWLSDPAPLVRELYRMLDRGGAVVATFPNDRLYELAAIDRYRAPYGLDWISQLDRGRGAHWKAMGRPAAHWRGVFEGEGFRTAASEEYFPCQAFEFTEIGLRPLFPSLVRMRQQLLSGDRNAFLELKRYWIENCAHFLLPLLTDDFLAKQAKVYQVLRFEKP